jgi:cell fate (sporulation/competence/biofilm development) regulator YlbF (YheA/YmcA/DUF963 family)
MEIQAMELMGKEISEDKLGAFDLLTNQMEGDPHVKHYFYCEKKVIDILSDIQKIMTDALNVRI